MWSKEGCSLLVTDLLHALGYPSVRKEKVANVQNGTVVRLNGEWGVKEYSTLDRWYGGRIRLEKDEIVEVPAPMKRKEER